jgi:DNA-binding NtrC family response regulator
MEEWMIPGVTGATAAAGHGHNVAQEFRDPFLGTSEVIRAVQAQIDMAACSDAHVVISGESGVGKELVAHLIHERSRRSTLPLVTIKCAGLPEALLGSALFGDAERIDRPLPQDRRGLLEVATGSTIFIDAIGVISLQAQAELLRVLQTGELPRSGRSRPIDVRIIAASGCRLADRVAAKEFDAELHARLSSFDIVVPPLRARREDVLPLLDYFLRCYAEQHNKPVPVLAPEAVAQLAAYDWPGNIRELKRISERLVVARSSSDVVTVRDLPVDIRLCHTRRFQRFRSAADSAAAGDDLFDRIVQRGDSFWDAVHTAFLSRDLTRSDVRAVLDRGLQQTGGNYKALVELFNMPASDYKRFLNFLRKYDCQLPFQPFRAADAASDASSSRSGSSVDEC